VGFIAFEEDTSDTLFTPKNAQSIKDARYISSLYSGSLRNIEVQFFAARLNNEGQNILTVEGIKEMQRLWDKVVVDSRVSWKGKEYSYTDVCTPISNINDDCRVRSVLQAFNFNRNKEVDNLGSDQEVLDAINDPNFTDVFQRPMRMEAILGGITRGDNGRITAAEAFASNINLEYSLERAGDDRSDPLIDKWEEEVVDLTLEFEDKDAEFLQVYVSNSAAASSESTDAINRDVRLLIIGYILIIVWCAVSLNRNSWVYQKSHLAFWAVIAIVLGAGAAFGLVSACGVKFNLTIQVSPFLLLGLGIDDTFVLIGTYFQQDRRMGVRARIAGCLAAGGTSITITSLTDFIAFIVGYWTDLTALQSFSAFVATGILFVYIFQITFFMGFLALDARREERALRGYGKGKCNPMGCACCCTNTADLENSPMPPPLSITEMTEGGADDAYTPPPKQEGGRGAVWDPSHDVHPVSEDQESSPPEYRTPLCVPVPWGPKHFDPQAPTATTLMAGVWLPRLILPWYGKVIVFLIEAAGLACAIYGCTKVYQDFRPREWFLPEGSWLLEAFQLEDTYFGGGQTQIDIYTKEPPAGSSYFDLQDELAAIPGTLVASEYMAEVPPFISWYRLFLEYVQKVKPAADLVNGRPGSQNDFMAWLIEWLSTPQGAAFEGNVVFNPDRTDLLSSKMTGYSKEYVDASWAVKLTEDVRMLAEKAAPNLNGMAFSRSFYNYDGFDMVTSLTLRNVITAAVAVFIVMLILLANIPAALLVLAMIVLCDVGLFGFMWWANLTFNIITFIILVIAVGISVDYSGHVARAFMIAQGTRQERAHYALKHIGGEVLNGAFTTWLAIIVLAGAKHYIFMSFFKLLFALVVLAIWHGVVFLPVCLSLIGPASYRSESPAKDKDSTDSDSVPGTKNKEVEEGTEVVAV